MKGKISKPTTAPAYFSFNHIAGSTKIVIQNNTNDDLVITATNQDVQKIGADNATWSTPVDGTAIIPVGSNMLVSGPVAFLRLSGGGTGSIFYSYTNKGDAGDYNFQYGLYADFNSQEYYDPNGTSVLFSDTFTFTRSSVANALNEAGVYVQYAINEPAFQYDRDVLKQGLLFEEQRTNLLTHSNDFENASWVKGGAGTGIAPVITSNTDVSPKGDITADTVVFNSNGSTSSDTSALFKKFAGTIGTIYTASFFIKAKRTEDVGKQLEWRHAAGANYTNITLTENFQRVVLTEESAITGTRNLSVRSRGDLSSGEIQTVMSMAQLEVGTFPTSPIITEESTQTRAAPTCVIDDLSTIGWNPNEGTIEVEFAFDGIIRPTVSVIFSAFEAVNNRIELLIGQNTSNVVMIVGGTSTKTIGTVTIGLNRIIISFDNNDVKCKLNDSSVISNGGLGTTNPSLFTDFTIGSSKSNATGFRINNIITKATYKPSATL